MFRMLTDSQTKTLFLKYMVRIERMLDYSFGHHMFWIDQKGDCSPHDVLQTHICSAEIQVQTVA